MQFYMLEKTVQDLFDKCSNNKVELLGSMVFKKVDGRYYFVKYTLDYDDVIKSTKKSVESSENFIERILLETINFEDNDDSSVIVRFHTHPGLVTLAYPSKVDITSIVSLQQSINRINMKRGNQRRHIYVEGIITSFDIGFYYYDGNEIRRIQLFTEKRELIPQIAKRSLFSSFKSGFSAGRSKGKKH